ncbi:hypothetical protein B0T20DRAFT_350356 [Sordaria brevicollis]|uniref:Uncharacterized protein n=1 Tax=Sordaria brevicollis TaxID=83679 RepID=A0AAE0PH02_SORBR|nr:hypothetical protein B0T20DRAFT_350356 [Sordaria brevicollis]
MKGTRSFQRVWPVSLGSPLQPGDSGSCVFDATTNAFYGHIVAGSTTSKIAYVVSAQEVFNDIEQRLTPLVQPSSSIQHPFRAQKAQLPVADDGPGVEDASVVFEVHATAEKYVAMNNDINGESSKQRRPPWETECMGFVRLVKNNSTGEVRLQLRSEPQATLVLDQPLDSDYTYREEPWGPKSVRISVATDKGKDSETWRTITKGSSRALADALEEHKMANVTRDE